MTMHELWSVEDSLTKPQKLHTMRNPITIALVSVVVILITCVIAQRATTCQNAVPVPVDTLLVTPLLQDHAGTYTGKTMVLRQADTVRVVHRGEVWLELVHIKDDLYYNDDGTALWYMVTDGDQCGFITTPDDDLWLIARWPHHLADGIW